MKISEVPMLTADEQEINLNGILYNYDYDGGYRFEGKCKGTITAYRVISINAASRHFRVRCRKGCELEYSFAKNGCPSTKFYGKISECKKALIERAHEDLNKCIDKRDAIQKTKSVIESEIMRINKIGVDDIKNPKQVKVKE